jgi:hypothetical protein
VGSVSVALVAALVLVWLASRFAANYEPYIKEQVVAYLEKEFESDVELADLRVTLPKLSPVQILVKQGRGVIAQVDGEGLVLRYKGRRDIAPLFSADHFHFDIDLGTLLDSPRSVPLVVLDGMQIHIPPKGERPVRAAKKTTEVETSSNVGMSQFVVDRILINNGRLVLLPKTVDRFPLEFALHRLQFEGAGLGRAMKYTAMLTNPKPKGDIASDGSFGPWNSATPSDTPLAGRYLFTNADLSVFSAIAGILKSTGTFEGSLSSLAVRGEASVPDFRLKASGNPVSLRTQFEAEVDGTNGNTTLKPIHATLGTTEFVTAGAVLKHELQRRRSIKFDVSMAKGNLRDLMRLAVKGTAGQMDGQIAMKSTIEVPPVEGKVSGKLILHGSFHIQKGQFGDSTQDKIDDFSRRGQGQPGNVEIDNVFSQMKGSFHMEDRSISLRALSFSVPGADVNLNGTYDIGNDTLDFLGALKLKAKVSQTLTGWKRWVAKPVDPFFAKNGAGTYLNIAVTGSSHEPKFGLAKKVKK